MIGILATCLLGLSPGVQLADTVDHRHVHLDGAKIQLVDYASDVGLNRMNREELLNELRGLEKPSFVTPIVLLSLGGVLGITGAIGIALGSDAGVVYGALAVVGGTVLIIVGAIILVVRFVQTGAYAEKLAAIQSRLDVVDQGPGGSPELPPPPPPPPPPPGAQAWAPAPQFLLAVF